MLFQKKKDTGFIEHSERTERTHKGKNVFPKDLDIVIGDLLHQDFLLCGKSFDSDSYGSCFGALLTE